ncbi:O-antigen ligase family protein [Aerococcaceae bacterium DSM 111020]|nr:O-antigen ligase family protein [Aerococcaceae bacterium DSM 111020]
MFLLVIMMAMAVFLGTEILAIPSPIAQITLYRVLVFGLVGLTGIQLVMKQDHLYIHPHRVSTFAVGVFAFWWIWAAFSGVWSFDKMAWMQNMFLLTLGVSAIILIYLHIRRWEHLKYLMLGIWFMMTLLLIYGAIEITFNFYPLADLSKLDKYGTFDANPLSRIPVTVFENQNDYATMLLAYLPLNMVLYQESERGPLKLIALMLTVIAVYLIYRTQSRLVLLSTMIFFGIYLLQQFKWHVPRSGMRKMMGLVMILGVIAILFIPTLKNSIVRLMFSEGVYDLTGDEVRFNLWRNGLLFLAQTLGIGVGAGNIEPWMVVNGFYSTENIVNIHNWWLEILVAYGIVVFSLYCVMYGLLIHRLNVLRYHQPKEQHIINQSLIAFLVAYAFASITSANNMLIEWHWVYFGLIICYIKLSELQIYHQLESTPVEFGFIKRRSYEYINNY